VESYLKSAEAGLAVRKLVGGADEPTVFETWSRHIDAIRGTVAMNLGDEERGFELSQRALKRLPESEGLWRSILALNLGDANTRRNEVDQALLAFNEAVSAARLSGNISSLLIIYASQASLLVELGQLDQAESIYRQALQTTAESQDASSKAFPTLGKINAFYSSLLYELNRVDEAAEQARQGIERCTRWGHLEHLVDSSLHYALAMQALSAGEQGMTALERVDLIVSNTIELLRQSGQLEGNRKIRWTAVKILEMRLHLATLARYCLCWYCWGSLTTVSVTRREHSSPLSER